MRTAPYPCNLKAIIDPAPSILSFICNNINDSYGSKFPESTVLDHMKKLRTRYTVFGFIINRTGISWNKNRNHVQVVDEVREAIIAVHPLAAVYREDGKGEGFWDEFLVIFGENKEGKKVVK